MGMTVADHYVAELAGELDGWGREHAAECLEVVRGWPTGVAQAGLLFYAASPIMLLVLKLGHGDIPGVYLEADAEWATAAAFARQEVLAHQAAGLDHGTVARSLALINRIDSLIGDWPEPDWSALTAARVEGGLEARRSGRARGERLRQERAEERERKPGSAGWFLRHPTDHYFRIALDAVDDPDLWTPLSEWISDFDASYTKLAEQDWSAEESQVGLVAEVRITGPQALKWAEPIRAVVIHQRAGDAPPGSPLDVCQVADPDAQFNGKLVSTLPQERWQICGHRRDDGSILIQDGTRRLQPAS